uniref:GB1/RHD3-type G domain-containing protein n=1 Tax=Urocitellus parryii TaxID=9999 RepID=A0A8D2HVP3_UROPR
MTEQLQILIPICLVENWNEQLTVNSEALRILENICQPLVVVAIVGTYRTGKSYLMNHLAGQNYGECGPGTRTVTKGIWMWCVPHPSKPNHTLVLLDTEVLGDVEKNDSWIFFLAVLLSSTFVYNSKGTIDHQALEQLHYVTELTQLIRAKSDPTPDEVEDSSEFVSFFPDFLWTVRDFMMELRMDGHPITEDEYLENALKLISDSGGNLHKFIKKGTIPCLKNAVTTLAQCENSAVLQKAADHYSEQMAQRVQFPTDMLQELLAVHTACEREAITVFMDNPYFLTNLLLRERRKLFLLQNEGASFKFCWDWLMRLLAPLMQSISRGEFSIPGGHSLLRSKGQRGPPELPTSTVCHRKSILQSDEALTNGEKATADERAKKEAAEKEQELLRQQQKEQQEWMEAQERSFQENMEQLKEKMERESENILREQERVLEPKIDLSGLYASDLASYKIRTMKDQKSFHLLLCLPGSSILVPLRVARGFLIGNYKMSHLLF